MLYFKNLTFIEKITPSNILKLSESSKRSSVMKNLLSYNTQIKNKFFLIPKSSWSFFDGKINININDDIPISNIKIFFNKNIPEWISVDLNGDKIFNENEKFISDEGGIFNIPLTLYSNRIVVAKDKLELANPKIIIFRIQLCNHPKLSKHEQISILIKNFTKFCQKI